MKNNELDEIKKKIEILINNNYCEEAIHIINKLLKVFSDDYELYSMYCVALIINNNLQDAVNIAKKGLEKNYTNFDLHYNLGYCYELMNHSDAIREYRKAWFYLENDDLEEELLLKIYTLEYGCNTIEEAFEIKKYYDLLEECIVNSVLGKSESCFDIRNLSKPKAINNTRVLFGPMEVANQMNSYSKGLNENKIVSYTMNHYSNYLGYESDFIINKQVFQLKEVKKISRLIAEFDIIHLFFGLSLMPDYSDLKVYKKMNKKVVMNHWGSDVRLKSIASKFNPDIQVKFDDEEAIKSRLVFLAEHIDNCIVADGELYMYVKEYYKNVKFVKQAISTIDNKIENFKSNDIFTIVHAPTSPEVKGSKYILNAIDKLKTKYKIEFILVQGMSNEEAVEIYKKADLIIDQIIAGTHGIFAIEAMALGKPVICYINNSYRDYYPDELPLISASKKNIEEVIENCILRKETLKDIGKQGIEYVEKYHKSNNVAKELWKVYSDI